jgi:hypothetical protein
MYENTNIHSVLSNLRIKVKGHETMADLALVLDCESLENPHTQTTM